MNKPKVKMLIDLRPSTKRWLRKRSRISGNAQKREIEIIVEEERKRNP